MSDMTTSDFSEAEKAYFSSKGEKTEALTTQETVSSPAPDAAPSAQPEPSSSPQAEAGAPPPSPEPGAVDEDEGVYLDEKGRARNADGKFVPHAALHKERERRKAVESEALAMRDKMARAEERLAILNEALTAPTQQAQQQVQGPPDPETDIFAYVKWQAGEIERLKQGSAQREQVEAQRAGVARLEEAYKADALSYMQEKPDFPDAYKYIANSYFGELKALGYSEAEARQRLSIEESNLAAEAFQRGVRPAQVIYERARARGYTPKQAAQAAAQPDPAQKINAIATAQAQQKSLGGSGGASGDTLTVESLANMSEAEFEAVYKRLGKNKMSAFLGG